MTYILTLQMDGESQAHFDRLREAYFPPERNFIAAHVTLFHTLPEQSEVIAKLGAVAREQARFGVAVTGLRSLGKGVAYTLESAALMGLHRQLATGFAEHLSAQDRQRFLPHVVVQNKVTPEAARRVLDELRAGFAPREIEATGLSLWHYRGGPWKLAEEFPFGPVTSG